MLSTAPPARFATVLGLAAVALVVTLHWVLPVTDPATGRVTTATAAAVVLAAPLALLATGIAGAGGLAAITRPALPFAVVAVPLIGGAARLLWLPCALVLLTVARPALVRLHARWRGAELVATASVAVLADAAGLWVLTVAAVWLAAYQAGVMVRAGTLGRLRPVHGLTVSAAGAVVAACGLLLTALSGDGLGASAAGAQPTPSAPVLLGCAAVQLGLALAARPLIDRWTAGAPVAGGLAWLAPRLVTVYLWHLPAVALVAVAAVRVAGYAPPATYGEQWRSDLPWWLLSAAVVLAVAVRLIGLLRRARMPRVGTALPRTHGLTGSSTLQAHGRLKA